jgi:curved DNA-binding protein
MEFKDYYKILGVARDADQKAVSSAFRKLARQHHPDVNKAKGAEDRFKEINEAYQVLGDAQKRARYDQMFEAYQRGGVNWEQIFGGGGAGPWQQQGGPGGWTVTVEGADLEDLLGGDLGGFSDFFRQFFGGGPAGRRTAGPRQSRAGHAPRREAEVAGAIEVTLDEVFHGAHKPIVLQLNGSERRLDVTIPKGVRDGQRIRLPGALDGTDLFLTVQVKADSRFERRGDDLIADVPVPLTDALLGGTVRVPTLEGSVEMTIPPGTQPGQIFRLRGQGMPRSAGGRGDELVRASVTIPADLSDKEKALLAEFARLRKERSGAH